MRDLGVAARWWGVVAVLCLGGLGVATYLTVTSFSADGPACGLVPGCKEVAASEYSRILDFPVAGMGVIGYSAMLLGSLSAVGLVRPPPILRLGLIVAAIIAAAFSVYLTVMEFAVIHAVCVYCFTSACISWVMLAPVALAERSTRKAPA